MKKCLEASQNVTIIPGKGMAGKLGSGGDSKKDSKKTQKRLAQK
jgi:hypothetical protein